LPEFFEVISPDQVVEKLRAFAQLPEETVAIDEALHRRVVRELTSPEDLPSARRSMVDGYAVRAEDTFGASDSIPALLEISGQVEMGRIASCHVDAGQAAKIPTGGYLPEGADSVVMVEYASPAGPSVEIYRPVTISENVLREGEDVRCGEVLFPRATRLRSCDLGLLAALGIIAVPVYRQPSVAVVSTGDEVVPIDRRPVPGQIRDANLHSIASLVRAAGGIPILHDIVKDDRAALRAMLEQCLLQADVLAFSGGSSVGERDLLVQVVSELPGAAVLAHGIAISPGKPTLLARWGHKAIFGLPGHPVSAWIVASVFLAPFLRYLQGDPLRKGPLGATVKAAISTSLHSAQGREDYVRVRLQRDGLDGLIAAPLFGKSGMLSTLARADGVIAIPALSEGISKGELVNVTLLDGSAR
jgi:molybdopterin molybdotransferase